MFTCFFFPFLFRRINNKWNSILILWYSFSSFFTPFLSLSSVLVLLFLLSFVLFILLFLFPVLFKRKNNKWDSIVILFYSSPFILLCSSSVFVLLFLLSLLSNKKWDSILTLFYPIYTSFYSTFKFLFFCFFFPFSPNATTLKDSIFIVFFTFSLSIFTSLFVSSLLSFQTQQQWGDSILILFCFHFLHSPPFFTASCSIVSSFHSNQTQQK